MSFKYPLKTDFTYQSLNPTFIPVSALQTEHFINYSDSEQRLKIISNYNLNESSKIAQHIYQLKDETKPIGNNNE